MIPKTNLNQLNAFSHPPSSPKKKIPDDSPPLRSTRNTRDYEDLEGFDAAEKFAPKLAGKEKEKEKVKRLHTDQASFQHPQPLPLNLKLALELPPPATERIRHNILHRRIAIDPEPRIAVIAGAGDRDADAPAVAREFLGGADLGEAGEVAGGEIGVVGDVQALEVGQEQQGVDVAVEDEDETVRCVVGAAECDAEAADEGEVGRGEAGAEAVEGGPGALGAEWGEAEGVVAVEDWEGFGVGAFVEEEDVEVDG